MARTPLSIGLLGAGTIATSNTGYLVGLAEMRDLVETAAIADISLERAQAVAARFGIPAVYGSLEELLAHPGLDAVVNITPIPLHAATSRQILAAGKHLVVEKPI
ncbi:MAG TPA: Gfo/Idh/MocA family oxidoreductase, partial [Chloroflexota bacterium]|nr:Gfo/Idh/MocA family oxidoreductase [Chloroflexota bacterium]